MDPLRYLETDDPMVAHVMMTVAERAEEIRDHRATDDATRTANAVARMLGGK